MPRERFLPDDPREWLGRARSNLAQARSKTPEVYPEDLCFAAQLSRYAVLTRYPGDDRVDESDYRAALNIAEAVVQWAEGEVGR